MGSKPSGISASRGASILGLNQYQTQFEIWQIIMDEEQPGFNKLQGYKMPDQPNNAFIRWGNAFEDAICSLAENTKDLKIIDRERLFSFENKEFITCHIDGKYNSCEMEKILHEGKTTWIEPFNKKWGLPGTDKIPIEYQVQGQHQMACTGAEQVILSVLVFPKSPIEWEGNGWIPVYWDDNKNYTINNENEKLYDCPISWATQLQHMGFFYQYHINKNQELIDMLVDKYMEFWNKNILEKIPPDPINIDDIKRITPNPVGTIVLSQSLVNLYREYKLIKSEIGNSGSMAKRAKQLKVSILEATRQLDKTIDDELIDKWLFYDEWGNKIGSWGKDKRGVYAFR